MNFFFYYKSTFKIKKNVALGGWGVGGWGGVGGLD